MDGFLQQASPLYLNPQRVQEDMESESKGVVNLSQKMEEFKQSLGQQ